MRWGRVVRGRRAVACAVVVLGALALAGCTSADPEPMGLATEITTTSATPTPTETETLDPAEVRRQEDEAAAQAAVEGFWRAHDAAARTGFADATKIFDYVAGEYGSVWNQAVDQLAATGSRLEGEDVLSDFTVEEYEPSDEGAGGSRIVLTTCVDGTETTWIKPDGSVDTSFLTDRTLSRYTLMQAEEGAWLIVEGQDGFGPC